MKSTPETFTPVEPRPNITTPPQPLANLAIRVWVSGTVVMEGGFANWALSKLAYQIGRGDTPPDDYTGTTYVQRQELD